MHGTGFLLVLLLVPLVTAFVTMRLVGNRTFVVVTCAVAAELIAIPLVRLWSRHAAASALAQARLEHRDFAVLSVRQSFGDQLVMTTLWVLVAVVIAAAVLGITQAARK